VKRERGYAMTTNHIDKLPVEEPLAALERTLISAYLAGAGQELHALLLRDDEDARTLLAAASRYATAKLAEIEARSQYLRNLHHEP
jgi:hypothetical protein